MFLGLPAALQSFISTILWTNSALYPPESLVTFQLRHQHAITNHSRIIFSNYAQSDSFSGEETEFAIQAQKAWIPRPESHAAFMAAREDSRRGIAPALDWKDWEVAAPDVSKRSTLHQLSAMAFNAYAPNNSTAADWYDLSDEWRSDPHGWGPEDDALRGHIFVSSDNTTVIISIKGTSAGWLVGGGGPTVAKDKRNDNLLFSCCCARVGPTWSTVCGCYDRGYRCDTDCVEDAMKDEGLFYPIGLVSGPLQTVGASNGPWFCRICTTMFRTCTHMPISGSLAIRWAVAWLRSWALLLVHPSSLLKPPRSVWPPVGFTSPVQCVSLVFP